MTERQEESMPLKNSKTKFRISKMLLPTLMLLAQQAFARSAINPITQAYTVSEVDELAGFKMRRTYSSGSVFRGHFGAGWCSEIDGRILIYDRGEIRYRGCDIVSADLVNARKEVDV